jgi:hypothetical protein
MEYEQLEQEYRDDHLAEAMYAREVEWFCYDFDRRNFEMMLNGLPAGEYRTMLEKRLADTRSRMAEVDLVYTALKAQITDVAAHQAATARAAAKRTAKK